MRSWIVIAALGALVCVPALAAAATRYYQGGHSPQIHFAATVRHDKVVKLRNFDWVNMPCGGNLLPNSDQFRDSIKVRHRRFRHEEHLNIESGVDASVRGRFNARENRAKGRLRLEGACNSGWQHWKAWAK